MCHNAVTLQSSAICARTFAKGQMLSSLHKSARLNVSVQQTPSVAVVTPKATALTAKFMLCALVESATEIVIP